MRNWLLLSVLAGCLQTHTQICEQGTDAERLCAETDICDDAHHLCVGQEQLDACKSSGPGAGCATDTVPAGICRDGVCLPSFCGDGVAVDLEECDLDDLRGMTCQDVGYYDASPLTCRPNCTFDESACVGRCGDNSVEPGVEFCDGNDPPATCTDFGFGAGRLRCSAACGPDVTGCKYLGWSAPSATFDNLYAIDGTDDSNVFAVGVNGTVVHWDGDHWVGVDVSGCNLAMVDLRAVTAVGPNEAWMAGTDVPTNTAVAAHVSSTGCQVTTIGANITLTDMDATSANDVWVAAGPGTWHYDGQTWTQVDSFASWSVYAVSSTNVYVTAPAGPNVRHFDGTAWVSIATPVPTRHVRGTDATHVYFGTNDAAQPVLRYDGTSFTPLRGLVNNTQVHAIGIAGDGDVFVSSQDNTGATSVQVFDGTSWTRMAEPSAIKAPQRHLYVSASGTVYLLGDGEPLLTRYQGTDLIDHPSIFSAVGQYISTAAAVNTGLAFIVRSGDYTMFAYDGSTWNVDSSLAAGTVRQIGVAANGDVLALTFGASPSMRLRTSPTTWSNIATNSALKFWARSSTDIWLAATGSTPNVSTIRHWDGVADTVCASCNLGAQINGIFGTATDDVYAWGYGSGTTGMFKHWGGASTGWLDVFPSTRPWSGIIRGMIGWSRSDVYVMTGLTGVYHFDGTSWSSTGFPAPNINLQQMWGTSDSDLFVADTDGDVFHYDGTLWSPVRIYGLSDLTWLVGAGSSVWFFTNSTNPIRQLLRTTAW